MQVNALISQLYVVVLNDKELIKRLFTFNNSNNIINGSEDKNSSQRHPNVGMTTTARATSIQVPTDHDI